MAGLTRGYVICATPRSGSNYLGQLLTSTGALGRPLEWFDQPAVLAAGVADYPADPEAQIAALERLAASPNGVYGLKVFAYQSDRAAATRWAARLPSLRFVHLTRADLLGQAISLVRAEATRAWTSLDAPGEPPAYSAEAIEAAMASISSDDARWRRWFARCGIHPLELRYEDLVERPQKAVDAVALRAGVPGSTAVDWSLVQLERQSDDLSDYWRQGFLADRADPGLFPP